MPAASRLNRVKSFFKQQKEGHFIAPQPMPALNEIHALPSAYTPPLAPPQQERLPRRTLPAPVQRITAQQIRELRELIRYRYSLDVEIWRQKNVKEFKRGRLKENMRRSDAALEVIRTTLLDWDRREFFASDIEHQKFVEIKNRLLKGQKANWQQHPVWDFVHYGGDPYSGPSEKYGQPVKGAEQRNGTQSHAFVGPQQVTGGARDGTIETELRRNAPGAFPNERNESQRSPRRGQSFTLPTRHQEIGVAPSIRGSRAPSMVVRPSAEGDGPLTQPHQSPKYRIANLTDDPVPLNGSSNPVASLTGREARRQSTWEAQRRTTGPQWQHEPVEHAQADGER
ncbi:hypothetical protein OPT61_g6031 [Boeremia exigua]|uniref:Uncharacterized protein n=1 Tax=Boeremia exigua TaxID=749465 RepID=A0ACC2I875_9PLEO|nr:hypothetical protein OPT61_g6031 [Boeremia exigua]